MKTNVGVELRLHEQDLDGVNTQRDENSAAKDVGRKWPRWDPYLFTAGVLTTLIVLLIVFGYVTRIPFVEHILFVLMTIAAVVQAVRKSSTLSSVGGNILLSAFFGLAGVAYFSKSELVLGIEYSVLAIIGLSLAVHAGVIRHRLRKEGLVRLDRAVETLRGVVRDDQ